MTTHKTFRPSREHPKLFLLLLVAVLVLWRTTVRLPSYHHTVSSHVTSIALFDQDEQKSKAACDLHQGLLQQSASDLDPSTALTCDASHVSFPALRDQQLSGPVRPSLAFYSAPAFVRPPPAPRL